MIDLTRDRLFSPHFIPLKLLTAAYALGLVVTHSTLPEIHVWVIACFFSVAMNFTYPWAACQPKNLVSLEVGISSVLIAMSVVSLILSPLLVIAAIFAHGLWDFAKHRGAGTPFFA